MIRSPDTTNILFANRRAEAGDPTIGSLIVGAFRKMETTRRRAFTRFAALRAAVSLVFEIGGGVNTGVCRFVVIFGEC